RSGDRGTASIGPATGARMNADLVDRIAQAVLYEGYILYPYRRSTKNEHRWTFGGLFPRDYTEACGRIDPHLMQTQCLVHAPADGRLSVTVRFLHLVDRQILNSSGRPVEQLEVDGRLYQSWQEAVEQTIRILCPVSTASHSTPFSFEGGETIERLPGG